MRTIFEDLIAGRKRAYLIGIGGAGMSALARVLRHRGLEVSGSDRRETRTTRELKTSGISVNIGQENVGFGREEMIIYSSAIRPDHVELRAARSGGLKVLHRAQVLSSLFNQSATSIAITGTHGKTTTSSMISFILSELGKKPTCLIGGDLMNFGTNTICGDLNLWVAEVDESDQTHEYFAPHYAVLTNLEEDHMDHYKEFAALRRSFTHFLGNLRDPGLIVYCDEDPSVRELVKESGKPALRCGFSQSSDLSAQNIRPTAYGSEFEIWEGLFASEGRLCVPGRHNISNALTALGIVIHLGVDLSEALQALSRFRGARRRLEVKYDSPELMIVDDYAHHPTEIRASLAALKDTGKHLTVVFQPHRFSRTQYLYKEFSRAFEAADEVILTDIYSAGEENTSNVETGWIIKEMKSAGPPEKQLSYIPKKELIDYLTHRTDLRGVLAFVGAGDIGDLADEFASRFKSFAAA